MSSHVATDRTVELLYVLDHALHGNLVGGVVRRQTVPGTGEQQNYKYHKRDAHDRLWSLHTLLLSPRLTRDSLVIPKPRLPWLVLRLWATRTSASPLPVRPRLPLDRSPSEGRS